MARILQLFAVNYKKNNCTMKNSGICTLVSFLGGMLVGSVVTMLVTPQSGPELRTKIRDYVDHEAEKIRCHCDDKQ